MGKIRTALVRRVQQTMRRDKVPPTRFGIEAANDPHAVERLLRGDDLKMSRIEKLHAYMDVRDREAARRMKKRARPSP